MIAGDLIGVLIWLGIFVLGLVIIPIVIFLLWGLSASIRAVLEELGGSTVEAIYDWLVLVLALLLVPALILWAAKHF